MDNIIGYEVRPVYKKDLPRQDVNISKTCAITKITLYGTGCHGFEDMIHPLTWKLLKENLDLRELIRDEILNGNDLKG